MQAKPSKISILFGSPEMSNMDSSTWQAAAMQNYSGKGIYDK
jgi:hypothetical protein